MSDVLLREILGMTLKAHRSANNMTLRELSAKIYLSLSYLSEVERGIKEPSSEMLELICKGLNLSIFQLMRDAYRIGLS